MSKDDLITGATFIGLLGMLLVLGAATPKQTAEVADGIYVAVDSSTLGALRHPDAPTLALWSEAAGIPVEYTYAVAWRETRNNPDPLRRGKAGEWGRFQIMPSTASSRCPRLDIRTSRGNLACFLKMTTEDYGKTQDWRSVTSIHNTGRAGQRGTEAYVDSVMTTVRTIVNERIR